MEALENATEQSEEPDKTGDKPQICVVYGIHRGKDCLHMPKRGYEHSGNKRETNPIWISFNVRLLYRKVCYMLS